MWDSSYKHSSIKWMSTLRELALCVSFVSFPVFVSLGRLIADFPGREFEGDVQIFTTAANNRPGNVHSTMQQKINGT